MTDYAGDAAATVVTKTVTADNVEAASKHATVDNAKKGYQAGVWANDKADELGIDKKAVAKKVGSAAWAASGAIYKASSSVNWGNVAKNV